MSDMFLAEIEKRELPRTVKDLKKNLTKVKSALHRTSSSSRSGSKRIRSPKELRSALQRLSQTPLAHPKGNARAARIYALGTSRRGANAGFAAQ
jgi:hypothetical protein